MKITCVESYILEHNTPENLGDSRASIEDRYWIVIELETDQGITGTGWMGTWRAPEVFYGYLKNHLEKILIGQNPHHIESINEELRKETLYYPGELGMSAHPRGAIDVALWDIKAQSAGCPLYELLGGHAGQVPMYMSCLDAGLELEEVEEKYREGVEMGFSAFKTKVGNKPLSVEVERLQTIREVVGDNSHVRIDANQSWTRKEARSRIKALHRFNLDWVEEPISEFDIAGYSILSEQVDAKIATGEMFYHPFRFRQLLVDSGIDIAQPDLIRAGGVTGQLKIANLCGTFDVPIAPHLYPCISAHVVCAVENGMCVEQIPGFGISPLLESPPEINDGNIVLPDTPGHGYRISTEAKENHRLKKR